MNLKQKITKFLNSGKSAWTGKKVVRYPVVGNPVFLELLEKHRDSLNYDGITTFFEGGTYNGNNAADFANVFDKVVTAEIDEEMYEICCDKHGNNNKIHFLHGSATEKLKEYLIQNPDERLVILLDDHDKYDAYIAEELEVIRQHSNTDHIIIIDDVDKLGLGTYPTKEEIEDIVERFEYKAKIIHDNERVKMLIFKEDVA